MTPPSLRFLGRRVYLGAVVVLITVMTHGLTESRVRQLRGLVGVDRRTLARWRRWWRETFTLSPFWTAARGRLGSPIAPDALPGALLERFPGGPAERVLALLRFLAPITSATSSIDG